MKRQARRAVSSAGKKSRARRLRVRQAAGLRDRGAAKFSYREGGFLQEGFVVKVKGTLKAYRNRCPHAGTPLDYGDGLFFTDDGTFLLCGTHGALFEPASGFCVAGPCAGERLESFPVTVDKRGRVSVSPAPVQSRF